VPFPVLAVAHGIENPMSRKRSETWGTPFQINFDFPEMGIATANVYFSGLYGCVVVWESRYVAESARPLRAAFFVGGR
jgi:hypothetical protein